MDPSAPQQTLFDFTRVNIVFAGLASGIVGTCFGHPLDLIKVRLQARSEYKGSWDCFAQTWRNDGLPGLFRGIGPPLFGSSLLNVVAFSSYSFLNDAQRDYRRRTGRGDTLASYNYSLSGIGVGCACAPVVCPIEVVKVRMQLDQGKKGSIKSLIPQLRRYKGSWDCFKTILRTEGFLGLYTGFSSTTMRDVSYSATYFSVYEPLKQFLRSRLSRDTDNATGFHPLSVILSGGISGALAWTAALPFDCIKTLVQQENYVTGDGKVGPVRAHYTKYGVKGFYSGWVPTILRAFAVSGIRFLVYEGTVHGLNNFWQKYRN